MSAREIAWQPLERGVGRGWDSNSCSSWLSVGRLPLEHWQHAATAAALGAGSSATPAAAPAPSLAGRWCASAGNDLLEFKNEPTATGEEVRTRLRLYPGRVQTADGPPLPLKKGGPTLKECASASPPADPCVRTATTDAGPPPCRPLFGQLPPTLVRIGGPPCRPMWCAGRLVVVKWWTRSFFSIPTKRQSTSSAHLQGHCHRTGAIDRNARMR